MHRTGELYGQFKTLEQQKDSANLGMWIFLVTEVMFFGGIMMVYTLNRHVYFPAFAMGSNTLSLELGGTNTIVLLASSFTMAMAVWSAQVGKKQLISLFPGADDSFGICVLRHQVRGIRAEIPSPPGSRKILRYFLLLEQSR